MKKEQAIEILSNLSCGAENVDRDKIQAAAMVAIAALSTASDDDLISRRAALEEMADAECGLSYEICKQDRCDCSYIGGIKDLPGISIVHCKDCFHTVPHWYPDPVSGKKIMSHFCTIVECDVEEDQYCWWGEDRKNVVWEWRDVNGDGTAWWCPNCGEISCCNDNYCPNCGAHMKGATR